MSIWRIGWRGATAGAAATIAMDLLWYRRYRGDGGDQPFHAWEFSTSAESFEDAPAPAKVGQRIAGVFGVELPTSSVSATNNVVHWSTGIGWGKVAALASAVLPVPPLLVGVLTGLGAWGASYATLGAVGVYQPIMSYDGEVLRKDLSAHLVFGTVLGLVLTPRRRSRG